MPHLQDTRKWFLRNPYQVETQKNCIYKHNKRPVISATNQYAEFTDNIGNTMFFRVASPDYRK